MRRIRQSFLGKPKDTRIFFDGAPVDHPPGAELQALALPDGSELIVKVGVTVALSAAAVLAPPAFSGFGVKAPDSKSEGR